MRAAWWLIALFTVAIIVIETFWPGTIDGNGETFSQQIIASQFLTIHYKILGILTAIVVLLAFLFIDYKYLRPLDYTITGF